MARILIAEDDKASLEFVRRALLQDAHQITTVEEGGDALAAATAGSDPFDLIVADISMPGLDGISLARQLASAKPGLRVLLMSGHVSELGRAKELGAHVQTLAKPFTLEQIREAVRGMLAS